MALVLRKAMLPKNISLLKWIKSRPLATAGKRTDATALSAAVPYQTLKGKTRQSSCHFKMLRAKMSSVHLPLLYSGHKNRIMRFCMSCPNINHTASEHFQRQFSSCSLDAVISPSLGGKAQNRVKPLGCQAWDVLNKRAFSDSKKLSKNACPPCGCGCCGCLPPPCNTPPKCIQYMTGYYYYPYGFWFCGPYHVTNLCTPCGPVKPGAPCPCPKCCTCLYSGMGPPQPMPLPPNVQAPCSKICPQQPSMSPDSLHFKPLLPPDHVQSSKLTGKRTFSQTTNAPQCASGADTNLKHNPGTTRSGQNTSTARSVISKLFPFQGEGSSKTSCQYSTQTKPLSQQESVPLVKPSSYFSKMSDLYPVFKDNRSTSCPASSSSPLLVNPRLLPTQEQRDKPYFEPGTFNYSSIPEFKKPFPSS